MKARRTRPDILPWNEGAKREPPGSAHAKPAHHAGVLTAPQVRHGCREGRGSSRLFGSARVLRMDDRGQPSKLTIGILGAILLLVIIAAVDLP